VSAPRNPIAAAQGRALRAALREILASVSCPHCHRAPPAKEIARKLPFPPGAARDLWLKWLIQQSPRCGAGWTCGTAGETIRTMAIDLTDLELETAARACRAMAYQEEQAAKRMGESGHARPDREHGKARRGTGRKVRGGEKTRMTTLMNKTERRIALSAHDFEEAEQFVLTAKKHAIGSREHEAALLAAITCYARPFSGNELRGSTRADSNLTGVDLQAVLGAEDLELHERIVTLRKKVVAHSEAEHNPVERIVTGVKQRPGSYGYITSRRPWNVVSEQLDLDALERISQKMKVKCWTMLGDVARKEVEANRV